MRCIVRTFFSLLAFVFLSGCTTPQVNARTFYTSRKDLASYILDTPDPEKTTMGLGQVIWVRWYCPKIESGTVIDATLRFNNGTEKNQTYPVDERKGWLMVDIPSEEHKEKGDIVSYKILLRHNNDILASTRHKLWVEKVEVKDT